MHGQDLIRPGLGGQGKYVSLRRRSDKYLKQVREPTKWQSEGKALQVGGTARAKALRCEGSWRGGVRVVGVERGSVTGGEEAESRVEHYMFPLSPSLTPPPPLPQLLKPSCDSPWN